MAHWSRLAKLVGLPFWGACWLNRFSASEVGLSCKDEVRLEIYKLVDAVRNFWRFLVQYAAPASSSGGAGSTLADSVIPTSCLGQAFSIIWDRFTS